MSIIGFILLCVVLGLIVWLINTYVPLPAPIQTIILVAVIIVLIVVLLNALGIVGLSDTQIPRLR